MPDQEQQQRTDQVAIQAVGVHLLGPWWASECVDPEGRTSYWLLNINDEPGGTWRADMAPHEATGSLSAEWRQRIGLTCAATTRTGKPCTRAVWSAGDLCHQHQTDRSDA